FLVSGDYPGDGKPKPVVFPEPNTVAEEIDGIRFLNLAELIELKLASGMTNPLRGQDLIDVQRLVAELNLPAEFANRLNPFVRNKFNEIWQLARNNTQAPE